MKATTEKTAEQPRVTARWKKIRDPRAAYLPQVTFAFRALCGACQLGELGYLQLVLAEEEAQLESKRLAGVDKPPDARGGSRGTHRPPAWLRTPESAASYHAYQTEYAHAIDAAGGDVAAVGDRLHRGVWALRPEALGRPGTGAVYRGHADSGYRITRSPGNAWSGTRVGRRPFRPRALEAFAAAQSAAQSNDEAGAVASLVFEKVQGIVGQRPLPPCTIWCPGCGKLNGVPLPHGFHQLADGGIDPRTDA